MRTIFYYGSCLFKYFLINVVTGKPYEVNEESFFNVVGFDRRLVPMHYDEKNINKQNFFLNGDILLGYRER